MRTFAVWTDPRKLVSSAAAGGGRAPPSSSVKDAVAQVTEASGRSRREIYALALELGKERNKEGSEAGNA